MALIKLSRINKGGDILVNTEHIIFIEVESRTTTVHLRNLLFSVEETPQFIAEKVEEVETSRIRNAIQTSGLVKSG